MPSISPGAIATVPLATGEYLVLDGICSAQVVSAMPPNVDTSIKRFSVGGTMGPYPAAGTVQITAGAQEPVAYDIDGPGQDEGSGGSGLTAAQIAAINKASGLGIQRANRRSAWARGPIIVAPLWAALTAVTAGQTRRLASGLHVVAFAGGTTGATEPVFADPGRPVTDGTVTWYPTEWTKTASDADAPTVSFAANVGAAGLALVDYAPSPAGTVTPARVIGARAYNTNAVYVSPFAFSNATLAASAQNSDTAAAAAGFTTERYTTSSWAIEMATWDTKIGVVQHNSNVRLIIEIDGQALQGDPLPMNGTSGGVFVIDFGNVYKRRVIRIVSGDSGPQFQGLAITSQGRALITAPTKDCVLWLGDSYTTTVSPGAGQWGVATLAHSLERYLGVDELVAAGIAGSGYFSANANFYTVGGMLAVANNQTLFAGYAPAHVIFGCGFNDTSSTRATVLANALAAWIEARRQFPTARITVLDGFSGGRGPDALSLSLSTDLAAQFAAWADGNSRFVPIVTGLAATAVVYGTGNVGTALTTGNASYANGSDGTHPSPYGARFYASEIALRVRAAWDDRF